MVLPHLLARAPPAVATREVKAAAAAGGAAVGQRWAPEALPPRTFSGADLNAGDGDALLSRSAAFRLGLFLAAVATPATVLATAASAAPEIPDPIPVTGSDKKMPAVGYGTCCRKTAKGPELVQSTKVFLANGGRLIDTAQLYGNHRDLGRAIKESGVPRGDLWITSKVSPARIRSVTEVVRSVDRSLEELGVPYLDLMLLHGGEGWGVKRPLDLELWKGLQEAKRQGKVRSIGVSNHNRQEIEFLTAETGVKPAVNQIEYHPWVPAETRELVRWCQKEGIAVTAYGSLGGARNKAEGDVVSEIASARGVSNAQVLLRWALDQGVAVIPGATSEEHIRQNLKLTGFQLTQSDREALDNSEQPLTFRSWHSCKSGCAS